MSKCLRFYAVDVKQLASLVGSGDQSVIDKVRREQEQLWWTDDEFDEDDAEIRLTAEVALQRILDGQLSDEYADDFNLALELLCAQSGEHIPMPSFEDIHYNFLDQLAVADELLATRLPFSFPYNPEDCRSCFLSRERIPELVDTLLENTPEHRDRLINSVRVEFWELLESLADEKTDLVAFYY